jgi:hypothetical protein
LIEESFKRRDASFDRTDIEPNLFEILFVPFAIPVVFLFSVVALNILWKKTRKAFSKNYETEIASSSTLTPIQRGLCASTSFLILCVQAVKYFAEKSTGGLIFSLTLSCVFLLVAIHGLHIKKRS